MDSIETRFQRAISGVSTGPEEAVLAAVSGGGDSTSLACLLAESGGFGRMVIAHVSHGMRPEEDPLDREHVGRLAASLDVEFVGESLAEPVETETDARNRRHEVLHRIAIEHRCNMIALGHNADDQAETLLWNLIRGSGLRGLGGIRMSRGMEGSPIRIIHPLLETRRAELRDWLSVRGIGWRDDPTNSSERHTRNMIRMKLVPMLEEIRPGLVDRLCRLAGEADSATSLLDMLASEFLPDPSVESIDLGSIAAVPDAVRRSALRSWVRAHGGATSLRHLGELEQLASTGRTGAGLSYPGVGVISRTGNELRIGNRA